MPVPCPWYWINVWLHRRVSLSQATRVQILVIFLEFEFKSSSLYNKKSLVSRVLRQVILWLVFWVFIAGCMSFQKCSHADHLEIFYPTPFGKLGIICFSSSPDVGVEFKNNSHYHSIIQWSNVTPGANKSSDNTKTCPCYCRGFKSWHLQS